MFYIYNYIYVTYIKFIATQHFIYIHLVLLIPWSLSEVFTMKMKLNNCSFIITNKGGRPSFSEVNWYLKRF